MSNNELTVNQRYKDSVFRMLFDEKAELLSLYNAVNGTDYDNTEDLEINTLEEGVFMKMKNDVSFVFGFELNLYEHQSSKCGNIALRYLFYVSDILAGKVVREDLYKSKVIMISAPRFVVFYNGEDMKEDRVTYKLSEQFEKKIEYPELELVATVININENRNTKIMSACETLRGYSIFVARIRKYAANMDIEEAVSRAINECINEGILADFLRKNLAEVKRMSVLEYNEELHLKNVHQDGYEEGHVLGLDEGISGAVALLRSMQVEDSEIIKKICEQYNLDEEKAKKYL
ncbi:hypothetical protein [Butyrivibrio sp. INlla16]|uniref:hypothetical protein n=1 Tax=Butyrivibrio sp. INlla16 TaxID=1520807 RepID=UPI00087F91DE|nr:hypothetical protein [Butyrivibrio sp. INlla16]SDB68298.1 hypothetical protein SAMN02910263_04141 [Butyrivibrio sp. INlla16]